MLNFIFLFHFFYCLFFFFIFNWEVTQETVSHIAISKEIWCCNKGPGGNTLGKQHQLCPSSLFFLLGRERKKKRGGKGGERSTQSGETWSWERLGFRKESGVAASFFFMSQGLSVSTQPQKYLTLQSWYLVIIFFLLSFAFLSPPEDSTKPLLIWLSPSQSFRTPFLAFPRKWMLCWGEAPAPWCGQAPLGSSLLVVRRQDCLCQGLTLTG